MEKYQSRLILNSHWRKKMTTYKTEQEKFWASEFGDEYISRNQDKELIAGNMALFSTILKQTRGVKSVIEFGSNIGNNLRAIQTLLPYADLSAIEINASAVEHLKKIDNLTVYHQSILDFIPTEKKEFVFIKGVLIHINPDMLPEVYQKLYETSKRYICIAEYYNPTPMELNYRGHAEKMYKRDFAGEIMDLYADLELVNYGFCYHRDPVFEQGDITWFLLEKKGY
jgi:pseudaminic acid biosynthesis-associated methylase